MTSQSIGHVALLVRDYDEALAFYVGVLGFDLIEDTFIPAQDKRWVLVEPPGSRGTQLNLWDLLQPRSVPPASGTTGGGDFS